MKQNKSFQDGLRQWISGNIRAKEEAQLDQLSQEDDFARDALEGFKSFADTDHQQNIEHLRQQLRKKEKPAVIIPIMLRRIAAAILFLVVVGTAWWLNQPNKNESLSIDQANKSATESAAPSKEDLQTEDETVAELSEPEPIEQVNRPSTTAPAPSKQQVRPSTPKVTPPAPKPAIIETLEAEEVVVADERPSPVEEKDETVAFRSKSKSTPIADEALDPKLPQVYNNLPAQSLSGKVLDQTGYPIAGALIRDLANQQEIRTDLAGNFIIPQNRAGQLTDLLITHFNYADTTVSLEMNQGLEISLKNQNASKQSTNHTQQPYPVGGFAYFQENANTTKQRKASKKEAVSASAKPSGTTIRFTVYANGKLANFRILSSPDKRAERNALRQLKQGPKWVLPSGLDSLDTQITIPMLRE